MACVNCYRQKWRISVLHYEAATTAPDHHFFCLIPARKCGDVSLINYAADDEADDVC